MRAASIARWRIFLFPSRSRPTTTCRTATRQRAGGCGLRVFSAGVRRCDAPWRVPSAKRRAQFKLSTDYYKGDRSMRESGFDVSFRFGAFGSATHHYAPVCLNSLLYKTEKDLEQISRWLGRTDDAEKWSKRAEERKGLITQYLWNAQQGLFFDFDFTTKQMSDLSIRSDVLSAVGGAGHAGASEGRRQQLKGFERPGGIPMSPEETGAQWDCLTAGEISRWSHRWTAPLWLQHGRRPCLLRVPIDGRREFPPRWQYPRKIQRGYPLVGGARGTWLRDECRRLRLDQCGFSRTAARLPKEMVERLEQEQNQPQAQPK